MTRTRSKKRRQPLPDGERLVQKGARALESVLDAVAEDPEAALKKAGEFFGKLLDTVERAHDAYASDPEGAKRDIRNAVVGSVANAARKRKKRLK